MKRIALLTALLLAVSCGSRQKEYVEWLYASMPLPDSLQYPRSFWEENVAKTLEVRRVMRWDIPEREFRHFVLPLRVNNETLDDFRTVYADTLCARVAGLSLADAALEINHWCHEQATYRLTGYVDFLSRLFIFFKNCDAAAAFRSSKRRHHSGRTAADHCYFFTHSYSLRGYQSP